MTNAHALLLSALIFWHFAAVRPTALRCVVRTAADRLLGGCRPKGFKKSFRRLCAGNQNAFVDEVERYAGNAEHPRPLFFCAHCEHAFFAGEEAFQLGNVQTGGRPDFNQFHLVGKFAPSQK